MKQQRQQIDTQAAATVYQMTDSQLKAFAREVVEEARDNMAAEVQRRVADAVGILGKFYTTLQHM